MLSTNEKVSTELKEGARPSCFARNPMPNRRLPYQPTCQAFYVSVCMSEAKSDRQTNATDNILRQLASLPFMRQAGKFIFVQAFSSLRRIQRDVAVWKYQ
eukprot:scaffold535624_cov47-Prasinocladus_malaysianus.AAC.1